MRAQPTEPSRAVATPSRDNVDDTHFRLQLAFYEHVFGDYRAMFQTVDKYRAVTAADCRRVAKQIFDAQKRTVTELVPETPQAAAR